MSKIPYNVVKRILVLALIIGLVLFLLTRHIDISSLLITGGLVALGATIFAETGLLIGFFLPGDTLLFAAGFFASQGKISLLGSIAVVIFGAFIGNIVGYEIGKRSGPKLFTKKEALLLTPDNIEHANSFYEKHGGKTIFLARFVPVVRTLAPLIAGVGKMKYGIFLFYNLSGAVVWGAGIVLLGYIIGHKTGELINIDKYLLPIILLATLSTFGISLIHILREPNQRILLKKKILSYFKDFFKN